MDNKKYFKLFTSCSFGLIHFDILYAAIHSSLEGSKKEI